MSAPSKLVRVAVPVPLADAFDYSWPESTPPPARGCRVVVPLGAGQRIGVVLNHPEHTDLKATKIKSAVREVGEKLFDLKGVLKEGDYLEIMDLLEGVTNEVNSL